MKNQKPRKPLHVWLLVREFDGRSRWIVSGAYRTRTDALMNIGAHSHPQQLKPRKFVMEEPKR